MNLRTIITTHLKVYGFGGLYKPNECACTIDDLVPCDNIDIEQCRPGFEAPLLTLSQADQPHSEGMSASGCGCRIQADKPAQGGEA